MSARTGMSERARPTLGRVRRLKGGFSLVEFKDTKGLKCSLRHSSLADRRGPFLWLGEEGHRMHLNADQVEALMRHLAAWLRTGTFEVPS